MSEAERDPHFLGEITTFTYDPEGNLISVEAPTPPGSKWEHDEAKRLFRITQPDGNIVEFHDRARTLGRRPRSADGKAGAGDFMGSAQDHVSVPGSGAVMGSGEWEWRVASEEWRAGGAAARGWEATPLQCRLGQESEPPEGGTPARNPTSLRRMISVGNVRDVEQDSRHPVDVKSKI